MKAKLKHLNCEGAKDAKVLKLLKAGLLKKSLLATD